MNILSLEILWYWVIGLAVTLYVVLDGFDLGVGMLHLFTKKDADRRIFLNAIGPIWDGNELWLVIVGGALFAGFPNAYATLFSSFYNLCMAFLAALIFRTVAIEFRSKRESKAWRQSWDVLFSLASYFLAFGLGVVLGNLIEGIPIDQSGEFSGSFASFLRPYPILVGLFSISLFMVHGALFLLLKTEGILFEKVRTLSYRLSFCFLLLYLATSAATLYHAPHMVHRMLGSPAWFALPILAFFAIGATLALIVKQKSAWAFITSALSILLLFSLYGVGSYPNLARSSIDPEKWSITLFNAASSTLTLQVLLLIVLMGIPLVLGYGFFVYRTFRGKVKIGPTSY